MSRTKDDWASWLSRHLPPGLDWLAIDPRVRRLLTGLGRVLVRLDGDAATFRADAIPSQSTGDRLAAWEDALALPDGDYPPAPSVAERQAEVVRVLAQGGIPTNDLYEALAAVWGVTALVWEPVGWAYHFWLCGPVEHIVTFRAGVGKCGEKLVWTSPTWDHIESLCRRWKPAHIVVHFTDVL